MLEGLTKLIVDFFSSLFASRKNLKMGIYGPPNSGKCVIPDTKIVLHNGEIKTIQEIFDEVRDKEGVFKNKDYEEVFIELKNKEIIIPSFDVNSLKIIPKPVSFVYSQRYKGDIYHIKTRNGREIKITPIHPLIRISDNGVQKVRAMDLCIGDTVGIYKNLELTSIPLLSQEIYELNNGMIQSISKYNVVNAIFSHDEITEIKKEDYDGYVYDLTIEDTHTFLISNGLIASNTTLANRICKDWIGTTMGTTSPVPHETREVKIKEKIEIKKGSKRLVFNLVDTPGIATKIDYEDFLKYKMGEKEAKSRAKEATKGVIESIKWMDNMDCVLVVVDASQNPYSQVNLTIIGNLAARNIPLLICANKMDLKKANLKKVEGAFPQYKVIGISAEKGVGMEDFYSSLFKLVK